MIPYIHISWLPDWITSVVRAIGIDEILSSELNETQESGAITAMELLKSSQGPGWVSYVGLLWLCQVAGIEDSFVSWARVRKPFQRV